MKTYFFGVIEPGKAGHYLYNEQGRQVFYNEEKALPFKTCTLDGGLLHEPEDQGRIHHAFVNGYTILGMWDRTGDSRYASNASFIIEGAYPKVEASRIAQQAFPKLWERIKPN